MKRLYGVVFALLLIAAPGWAANGVWEPTRIGPNEQSQFTFTTTSDSTIGLEVRAPSVVISFELDMTGGGATGGAANIYTCSTQGSSASPLDFADCTQIASCVSNSPNCYTGSAMPGYIGVDVTGDPSGTTGTSRITVRAASNTASAGGGGGVPGFVNGIGNDATMAYLMSSTGVIAGDDMLDVYFSADAVDANCIYDGNYPQGNDDTGTGSKTAPFRSWGKLMALAARGNIRAIYDSCDTWETNDGGAAGDNESTNFLLSDAAATNDTFRVGTTDMAFCSDAQGPCMVVIGSDPKRRPIIDPEMYDGGDGPDGSSFFFDDVAAIGDRAGWWHFEGMQFGTAANPYPNATSCATASSDLFDVNRGLVSARNLTVYMCGNNNEVWTSHNTDQSNGFFVGINIDCIMPDVDEQNSACFWEIGGGNIALIGGSCQFQRLTAAATNSFCVRITSGDGTQANYAYVYGMHSDFRAIAADTDGILYHFAVGALVNNSAEQRMFVARSKCLSGGFTASQDACFGLFDAPTTSNYKYISFRNSSYDLDSFIDLGGIGATEEIDFKGRCNVHYAGANGLNRFLNLSGNCSLLDFDVKDQLIEDTATTVVSVVEGVNFGTITSGATGFCDDAPVSRDCNTTGASPRAWTQCTMTDTTADPFGTNGAQTGVATTAQADNDCTEDMAESFRYGLYIPPYLLDGRTAMRGVLLAGVGESIGP